MSDEKRTGSLFGLPAWNGTWKAAPLTRESLRAGFEMMWKQAEKERSTPTQRTMYESQATVNQMAADFEADPEFARYVKITRGPDGNVTSIEW